MHSGSERTTEADGSSGGEVPQRRFRRRKVLVSAGLQLRLTAAFALVTAIGLVAQLLLVSERLAHLAIRMPNDSAALQEALPGTLGVVLALSFALVLPTVLLVGIRQTFRVAGPLYRIERYLADFARGEEMGPLRLRKQDELEGLRARVEEAVAAAQQREAALTARLRALEGEDLDRAADERAAA